MTLFNQRTDKYGGDLKGRLRFATEIVETIKNKCGKDFPVILRFSIKSYIKQLRQGGLPGEDFKELGRDIDEAIEAVKILQEAADIGRTSGISLEKLVELLTMFYQEED